MSGAVVYTNRLTDQQPVAFDLALPEKTAPASLPDVSLTASELGPQTSLFSHDPHASSGSTVRDDAWVGSGANPADQF